MVCFRSTQTEYSELLQTPAQLTVPKADEIKVGSCPQDDVLKTPVMPVLAEALTLLHNLIKRMFIRLIKRMYSAYRGMYRSLPMPKHPLPKVRAILRDQNHLLIRMNNVVRSSEKGVACKGKGWLKGCIQF